MDLFPASEITPLDSDVLGWLWGGGKAKPTLKVRARGSKRLEQQQHQ